jgi:hypothetical protein
MTLYDRIDALVAFGQSIDHEANHPMYVQAKLKNPWFSIDNIKKAIDNIQDQFLNKDKLNEWLSHYTIDEIKSPKKVGLILAGNIPLVGIHDILSVFLSGHESIIKMSDKDTILTTYLINQLIAVSPETSTYFSTVERLTDYDAVIATGSDSTSIVFKKYFSHVPHIIRRNRNGVAVISTSDDQETLKDFHHDLFDYFGLGCRNVSKVYLEQGVSTDLIFESIINASDIINHNKYKNNYDYAYALYLMNQEDFKTNDVLIMRDNESIASRIACLHYEYYQDISSLEKSLSAQRDNIQCIVSSSPIDGFSHFKFGEAQYPALSDYADGVDTIQFLSDL